MHTHRSINITSKTLDLPNNTLFQQMYCNMKEKDGAPSCFLGDLVLPFLPPQLHDVSLIMPLST